MGGQNLEPFLRGGGLPFSAASEGKIRNLGLMRKILKSYGGIKDQDQGSGSRIKDQDQGSGSMTRIKDQDQGSGSRIRINDQGSESRIRINDQGSGSRIKDQGSRIR